MMGRDINMSGTWLTLRPEGETAADVEESVHDFLGDSNFQQLQQYQATEFVLRGRKWACRKSLPDTDTAAHAPAPSGSN